ncbi:MAG: hypothetical protein M1827_003496 [Pycnora praestabilis]|nr:MAG: hypothetical protein M1827_003496 [Pycnora praestabilis]
MPVKWTPDVDQILLLKILETHDLSVDAKKVSAAWPSDRETPTARAISERLVKIRSMAKANGAGHFAVSSGRSTGNTNGNGKGPSTPRKPRAPKANGGTTTGNDGGSGKRKRTTKNVADNNDDEEEGKGEAQMGGAVKLEGAAAADTINTNDTHTIDATFNSGRGEETDDGSEDAEDGVAEDLESPTKKLRLAAGAIKREKYASDGEEDGESVGSDYADAV